MATLALASVGALITLYLFTPRRPPSSPHKAYILQSKIVHARLQPAPSAHAFAYPLLSLLLPLRALEAHALDCARGWVFGYGGLWGRLTGLRPGAYLSDSSPGDRRGIRTKLQELLDARGLDGAQLGDAWMLTMPSYLGFEGINPLTVYFCYKPGGEQLWSVILEIHNTFGERHVHVLEIGKAEDPAPAERFDHQWTFSREFHVSPFNDRSGFYIVSVVSMRSPAYIASHTGDPPLPAVRVHLHTAADTADPTHPPTPGPLKLTASLRAIRSEPLTTRGLMCALACQPFILLLSMARICYHAWILHYVKRLDVFPRPAPFPAHAQWNGASAGGVGWLPETSLEQHARGRVEAFLSRRAREAGINVTLVAADPAMRPMKFECEDATETLTVWYLGPEFYTTLFMAPSTRHAVLLGSRCEGLFTSSSAALFDAVFAFAVTPNASCVSFAQRLRVNGLPSHLRMALGYEIPPRHLLDRTGGIPYVIDTMWVCAMLGMNWMERRIYRLARARFVAGKEPWLRWERAAEMLRRGKYLRMANDRAS